MIIKNILKEKNITMYELAKSCNISQSTISEICSGVIDLSKCNAKTVYLIAKKLEVPMEQLLAPSCEERCDFELFKSNVCHSVKYDGYKEFIAKTLTSNIIEIYYRREWYPECLYTLAMVDYLSRIHNIPTYNKYNYLRHKRFEYPIYPSGVLAVSIVEQSNHAKLLAMKECIPEFLRHNIIEAEVENVI